MGCKLRTFARVVSFYSDPTALAASLAGHLASPVSQVSDDSNLAVMITAGTTYTKVPNTHMSAPANTWLRKPPPVFAFQQLTYRWIPLFRGCSGLF